MAVLISDIIASVRLCIDEKAGTTSSLSGISDDYSTMTDIIMDKLGDALRWMCLYGPAEQLSNGGTGTIKIIKDLTSTTPDANGRITLGTDFIRLVRVKGKDWHRAIYGDTLIKEDSDEYLQLNDANGATATADRPQAAIINKEAKMLEVWPSTNTPYEVTVLAMPDLSNITTSTTIALPDTLKSSFIYYLAFLLCSAYGDERAPRMLEIAKMNLGLTEDKQRL